MSLFPWCPLRGPILGYCHFPSNIVQLLHTPVVDGQTEQFAWRRIEIPYVKASMANILREYVRISRQSIIRLTKKGTWGLFFRHRAEGFKIPIARSCHNLPNLPSECSDTWWHTNCCPSPNPSVESATCPSLDETDRSFVGCYLKKEDCQ